MTLEIDPQTAIEWILIAFATGLGVGVFARMIGQR